MALQRDARYPNRYDPATPAQPQGAFKNRTTPTSQDGAYMERDWLNDWSACFSSLLVEADITPNNVVDEVGASQYYDAMSQLREVEPRNNDWNGYFDPAHQAQLPSPAGYPNTTPTPYSAGDEWSLGNYALGGTISVDSDGAIWSLGTEKRYEYTQEQIDLIDVNKVPVFIKAQDGKVFYFKNGDAGVVVSIAGTTLTVTLDAAIFGVTGIDKVWRFFVTDKVGSVVELSTDALASVIYSKLTTTSYKEQLFLSLDTTYTNELGVPFHLWVVLETIGAGSTTRDLLVGGSDFSGFTIGEAGGLMTLTAKIGSGETYRIPSGNVIINRSFRRF